MFCDNGKMKQDTGLINCKVCKGSGISFCYHMLKTNYNDCIFLHEYFGCISFHLPPLRNSLMLVCQNQYIVSPQGEKKGDYTLFPRFSNGLLKVFTVLSVYACVSTLYRIDFLQEMWRFWLFPSAMSC